MDKVIKINGQAVTLKELAKAWLAKAERFTDVPWQDPVSNLSAEDYAKVCLIDLNEPGKDKIKSNLKLPVKSTPNGPYNKGALRAAAAALAGARGGVQAPADQKRKAAARLVRLMEAADIEVGDSIRGIAGLPVEKAAEMSVPIVKADNEKQVVYGVALKPFVPDSQKDQIDPADIEQAAWGFMRFLGQGQGRMDLNHERVLPLEKAYPVESYIAQQDMVLGDEMVPAGSWVMAVHVPDAGIWQMIKSGKINALSIRGTGRRTPVG